jgi:kanamycin kinase
MKYLHSQAIIGAPRSMSMDAYDGNEGHNILKCDTLIHGDFCLPNVIFDKGKFSAFIDLGGAGVGDRHIDIFWLIWSLNYNLGTNKYADYVLDLYGRDKIDENILKFVAEVENVR